MAGILAYQYLFHLPTANQKSHTTAVRHGLVSWTTDLRNNTYLLRAPGAGIPSTLFPRQHPVSAVFQTDDRVLKDILRVYDSFVHTYPCPPSESFGWRLSITGGSKAESMQVHKWEALFAIGSPTAVGNHEG
jgi:hypothetical protein